MISDDDDALRHQLQGRTLEVYRWLLIQKAPQTARQIKEGTGFSSVSLAKYHLKKLCDAGLVDETDLGEYSVIKEKLVGELRFYIYMRQRLIPRFLFYSIFYGTLLILSVLYLFPLLSLATSFFILIVIFFALGTSLFETFVLVRGSSSR
ncbi:MAG: helix-turn-helix domain-containing protein [Candidatus Thorarchaeota archaeon]|nr:helix-turn-helix domain-containing protein [Candidatus Thorarchaeota archaeon]